MVVGKWKFSAMCLLLFLALLADGALAGAAFAVANRQPSVMQPSAVAKRQPSAMQSSAVANQQPSAMQSSAVANRQPSAMQSSAVANRPPSAMQSSAVANQQPSAMQSSAVRPLQVALTFDDGPHQTCTPALLNGLKQRGVKATFFLMGENIAGKEPLVQRMQAEGHLIGNHGYRHIQMTKEEAEQACADIEQTEKLIQSITGKRPEYLRPPYGDWNEQLECRVNLTTVLWNVDSLDWKFQNTDRIVRRVEKDVKDGDIILMHDIFPTSVEAALRIVDDLQKRGYEFVTVEELLVD